MRPCPVRELDKETTIHNSLVSVFRGVNMGTFGETNGPPKPSWGVKKGFLEEVRLSA